MKKLLFMLTLIISALFMFSCGDQSQQPQETPGTQEPESYTVSFDSDGGSDVKTQTVKSGKLATKPEDPEKDNSEFLGWYLKGKKFDFKTPITSNITLKAKWEAVEYEVRFSSDGGTRVKPIKVEGGTAVDCPENPTKENYNFLGWYLDGKKYDFSLPVTEDITLTAKWEEVVIPDDEIFNKMQSVLLLGQSNMVGIGDILTVEAISDERIYMMRDDEWIKMREPLHTNAQKAGVGIGGSFSKAFVETFDCKLGLIPAAEGASTLSDWAVGGRLYNEAVRLAKLAQKNSEICAILWHQGEGNQNTKDYADQLHVIFDAMIEELGLDPEKIVIITGELYGTKGDAVHTAQLNKLASYYQNYGVASSDGLKTIDAETHFDAPSMRVFGYRYFDIFYNCITGKSYEFDDDPESYRTAPSVDNGVIAEFDFEDMNLGKLYNGPCGNGKIVCDTTAGEFTITEFAKGNKHLLITNDYDEVGKKYSNSYIDSYNKVEASSIVVLEAKFMLASGSASPAYLLLTYDEDSQTLYRNVYLDENGEIYYMYEENKLGTKIGKLSEGAWTTIRVVMDLEYNVKDVYVNDELVVRAAKISTKDMKDCSLERTRIVYFASGEAAGAVMVDDYKCFLYADNIAPGK